MGLVDLLYRLSGRRSRATPQQSVPVFRRVPQHIAVIMDGNGRWAKRRGLPRVAGHRVGVDVLKEMVKACADVGVKYLTAYAFSTENWRRPQEEVRFLMQHLQEALDREMDEMEREGVRVRFLGRTAELDPAVQQKIQEAMARTARNRRITLSVMFNYGGRSEIVDAMNQVLTKAQNGRGMGPVTEEELRSFLYTAEYPDPDLLIRTGGEQRVSNYLLWQTAYAELWFTPVLWPDVTRETLFAALRDYERRERRFGDIQAKVL